MYEITVPEDVAVLDLITEKPTGQRTTFVEWLRANMLPDLRFSLNEEALEHQQEIRDAIRNADPGQVVQINPAAYKLLAEVAKSPKYRNAMNGQISEGYGPYGAQYLVFMEAIRKADRVKEGRKAAGERPAGENGTAKTTERREVIPPRAARDST